MNLNRLLLLLFLVVSATMKAQQLDLKINAVFENEPLPEVFYSLEKTYDLHFAFDSYNIRNTLITCNYTDTELLVVLSEMLSPHGLGFKEYSGTIVIFREEEVEEGNETPADENKRLLFRGEIRNADTRELLPFANVHVKGTSIGTSTNYDGKFVLELDSVVTDSIELSYVGCEPLVLAPRDIRTNRAQTFYLHERRNYLPTIVILPNSIGLIEIKPIPSQFVFNPSDISTLIGPEPDIMRAAQLLPSISATNESSSGLNIRGGASDQTLITLDGFTLYHLDHFFGAFSSVNVNAVKNMRIMKGGFDAAYGNRVAGIVEITGKEGNLQKPSAQIDLGALSIGGVFEAPLNNKGTSSMIITARRAYTDALFSPTFKEVFNTTYNAGINTSPNGIKEDVSSSSQPDFHFQDANIKLTFRPGEKDVINLSGFTGKDQLFIHYADTMNDALMPDKIYTDESMWRNQGVGVRWAREWHPSLRSTTQLGISRFLTNYFSIDSTYTISGFEGMTFRNEKTSLTDLNFKTSVEYRRKYHSAEAGLQVNGIDTKNEFGNNEPINQRTTQGAAILALYVQDEWSKVKQWVIKPGFRLNHYSITGDLYPEYRMTAYRTSQNREWTFKVACGRVHQFIQRLRSQSLYNNNPDYWKLSTGNELPVLRSDQFVAGILYKKKRWTIDLEGYYKINKGNTIFSGIYGGSSAFVVSDSISSKDLLSGTGYSYGSDLLLQYDAGHHHAWISYTWLTAVSLYKELDLEVVPESFQQRHEFKVYYELETKRWEFNIMWVYGSGRPYTPLLGLYNFPFPDGTSRTIPVYGDLNSARLPAYHRLDAGVSYQFYFGNTRAKIQFSCFNLYNRQNVRDIQYINVPQSNDDPDDFIVQERKVLMLGFLPSINLNLRF